MPIPTSSVSERAGGGLDEPQALGPRQQAAHGLSSGNGQSGGAVGAGVNTGAGVTREKTEAEKEADRQYEEAMEEEYAKREGGA
ncbi:hypothetical protein JX265_000868 [Neoarthrinium moseri]|uniref:Uncharacterized protein n=1 Tax=Neoarthrinium moseri TaxID=1658444 RepID=A0A9P9WX00_9PEZI|nr:uncharacterized protein JN550_007026 [Neoarthrinium moseri]KAI1867295.1 hypothetical protein JN550_007026 [Neoarthrinium moseri]KAI1880628.1 hypothetical protein JX265_000868 [Neoarthrinium moseri]